MCHKICVCAGDTFPPPFTNSLSSACRYPGRGPPSAWWWGRYTSSTCTQNHPRVCTNTQRRAERRMSFHTGGGGERHFQVRLTPSFAALREATKKWHKKHIEEKRIG